MANADSGIVFLYVTFPASADIAALAERAIAQQLIACANVFSMRSVYRWQGNLCNDAEQVAIFKTTTDREAALRAFIAANHPYQVPCVASLPIASINAAFGEWVVAQTH